HRGVTGSQFVEPRFKKELKPVDQRFGQYYIRFHAKDEAGVFSRISSLFNEFDISFKQILHNPSKEADTAELVVITHRSALEKMQQAVGALIKLATVRDTESSYQVEGDAEAVRGQAWSNSINLICLLQGKHPRFRYRKAIPLPSDSRHCPTH